ncbi:hypothetical protein Cgig2_010381 [Carnegiea gigantea]|uniref:Cell division cycle 20 n=1 Tax=Carnegiea gigantea TaxID=171969 RepID=A0A9Q1QDY1_9CARY|nr:hypothetical protein Cgig2_010381 [Carnegiea gigantea]
MNCDFTHHMLFQGSKGKENRAASSPSKEAYRRQLREVFGMNRARILAFKNQLPAPVEQDFYTYFCQSKPAKPRCYIPQSFKRTLDASDLIDDFYLNLLDWGCRNVLAIALGSTVYMWDASNGSTSKLVIVDDDKGPVTSVNWMPDGCHTAIGLNNSEVQLWNSTSNRQLRTLRVVHRGCVGSLAWKRNHILTTGSVDGRIINNDVRIRHHVVETYRGHSQEICGLIWSYTG